MADNSSKTLLTRKAVVLGSLSKFDLPPFPELPATFLKRFPELKQHEEDKKLWSERFINKLSEILTTKKS